MLALTRFCIRHRRLVVIAWVVVAIVTTVIAQSVGRNYSNNFSLPGTDAQRAADLLTSEFPTQSGDTDQIVWHVSSGTFDAPAVKAAIEPVLERVGALPHVVGVISPYTSAGAVQVSPDRRTAFATVLYDKRANFLPNDTGNQLLDQIHQVRVPGLTIAAGGQVIENAEGFNVGPATAVGAIAALFILLLTFGSLTAAGMPLLTAGFGLITGIGLIGLFTHVIDTANTAPELALMIGLGVGIDYALFIVTRFRELHRTTGDVQDSVVRAMDTSGRAVLLAGATVCVALLGMFAVGVNFLYGMSIASVLAVLCVLGASLTVLPALLSRFGERVARPSRRARKRQAAGAPHESAWRRWSQIVQARPWPLAIAATLVMLAFVAPIVALRLDSTDAGNDASGLSTRVAYDLLARGFGPGFNGPLLIAAQLPPASTPADVAQLRMAVATTPGVAAVGVPRVSESGKVAVLTAYPTSAPEALATTDLVNHLRDDVLPPLEKQTGLHVLIGGFTAASIDFSRVLANKLPLFVGIVVAVSALLLFVIFRSLVIPVQAAVMNLLSIGGALGATVAIFQWGWFDSIVGVTPGPIEPWIPVIMFAVVFGLSMDYEVFLLSRVREEWVRTSDARRAVGDGIASTGRVITAAAAIMICVFLSFMIGDLRVLKEFGFALAIAVFLDAVIVRCVLLPSALEILGPSTWWLPRWLDKRMPYVRIEGTLPAPDLHEHVLAAEAPEEEAEQITTSV